MRVVEEHEGKDSCSRDLSDDLRWGKMLIICNLYAGPSDWCGSCLETQN